jgi:dTDP-4-dehydrorhamnose reductase
VGHALLEACQSQGLTALGLGRNQAPLHDLPRLRSALIEHIQAFQPSHLINAAAYTAVDRAETEPDLAYTVNAQAVGVIGEIAASHKDVAAPHGHGHGLPVVHYSTDYVFDGQKPQGQAYRPTDPVSPQSVYGQTKLKGEQALAQSGARALILRTSWVFSDHGANFLKTMLRLAQERDALKVVADQHGAPTSAAFIAESTLQMLAQWPLPQQPQNNQSAIYHLSAAGQTTWHAFACALIGHARQLRPDLLWKIQSNAQIQAITTAEYNAPAARPMNSLLDCSATECDFDLQRSAWPQQMETVTSRLLGKSDANSI